MATIRLAPPEMTDTHLQEICGKEEHGNIKRKQAKRQIQNRSNLQGTYNESKKLMRRLFCMKRELRETTTNV